MEAGYIAELYSKELGKISEDISRKLRTCKNVEIEPRKIFIVAMTQEKREWDVEVKGKNIVRETCELSRSTKVKIKAGKARFSCYDESEVNGISLDSLKESINSAYKSMIKRVGEQIGMVKKFEGVVLDVSDFDFEESLEKRENVIKPRMEFDSEEAVSLLKEVNRRVREGLGEYLKSVTSRIKFREEEKLVCNSGGAKVFQKLPKISFSIEIYCKKDGKEIRKLVPSAFTGGIEVVKDFVEEKIDGFNVEEILRSTTAYLKNSIRIDKLAHEVNFSRVDLVLSPSVTGITLHEALGHDSEIDWETADKIPSMWRDEEKQLSKEFLNVSFVPNLRKHPYLPFGFYVFDDEGVRGKESRVMVDGRLNERLNDLTLAKAFGVEPNGHSRGNWVRMSNLKLDVKGNKATEEELLEEIKGKGIYVDTAYSGRVDVRTKTFVVNLGECYFVSREGDLLPIETVYLDWSSPLKPEVRVNLKLSMDSYHFLRNIEAAAKSDKLIFPLGGFCGKGWEYVDVSEISDHYLLVKDAKLLREEEVLEETLY